MRKIIINSVRAVMVSNIHADYDSSALKELEKFLNYLYVQLRADEDTYPALFEGIDTKPANGTLLHTLGLVSALVFHDTAFFMEHRTETVESLEQLKNKLKLYFS